MISKNVVEPLEDPFEAANVEASVKFPNTGASFRWNLCAWPGTGPKHPGVSPAGIRHVRYRDRPTAEV
jgi:hypothetical protein